MLILKNRNLYYLLMLIVLIALIRLFQLGHHSLDYDEILATMFAQLNVGRIMKTMYCESTSPCLYYVLTHYWMKLFGDDPEWKIRLFSCLLAVGSVPLMYLLGRRLLGYYEGIVAASLLAVSTYHIWVSQTARSYTLLVLGIILLQLASLTTANRKSRWPWVWIGLTIAMISLTHHYGIFVVFSVWVSLWCILPDQDRVVKLGGMSKWGLLFLGVGMPFYLAVLLVEHDYVFNRFPSIASMRALLTTVNNVYFLPASWKAPRYLSHALYFISASVAVFGLWGHPKLSALRGKKQGILLAFQWTVVPLTACILTSCVLPCWPVGKSISRYWGIVLPGYLLLVASGACALFRHRPLVGLVLLTVLSSISVYGYFMNNSHIQDDWRLVCRCIHEQALPGDQLVGSYEQVNFVYYWDRTLESGGNGLVIVPQWRSFSPAGIPTETLKHVVLFGLVKEVAPQGDYSKLTDALESEGRVFLLTDRHTERRGHLPVMKVVCQSGRTMLWERRFAGRSEIIVSLWVRDDRCEK